MVTSTSPSKRSSPKKLTSSSKKTISSTKNMGSAPKKMTEFAQQLDDAFRAKVSPSLISRDGVGDDFVSSYGIRNVIVDFYKTTDHFVLKMGESLYSTSTVLATENNPKAKDTTYAKLIDFVEKNSVGRRQYVKKQFMCADFATMIHNRAEAAGIRCGIVTIEYKNGRGHAFTIFNTTDKGILCVDLSTEINHMYNEVQFRIYVDSRARYVMILT